MAMFPEFDNSSFKSIADDGHDKAMLSAGVDLTPEPEATQPGVTADVNEQGQILFDLHQGELPNGEGYAM